jgi:hypothetical protein
MKRNTSNKRKETKNLLVPITFFSTSWRAWVGGASENKYTKGIMKKTVVLIALAAALQTVTVAILAQNGPGRGRRDGGVGGHRPPPSPVVMVLDANHDLVIDAQEIANAPAALATLDKNGDGKLTPDELRPRPPQGGSGGNRGANNNYPTPPLVQALDANGDGTIDAQEIANSSTALKSLDANGDGQLTHDEFCPPPPDGGPGGQQ